MVSAVSNAVTVTVTPGPSVSISPSAPKIDSGQSITLTATASGGSGTGYTYTWYSGSSCTGTVLGTSASYTTPTLTNPPSSDTYCVMVTDSLGGTGTNTVTVTVYSAVSAWDSFGDAQPCRREPGDYYLDERSVGSMRDRLHICVDESAHGMLDVELSSNQLHAECRWYRIVSTVTLTVTDSIGGTGTATLTLTVHSALVVPTPTVTHNPADVGQSITFTAAPTGGFRNLQHIHVDRPSDRMHGVELCNHNLLTQHDDRISILG